MSFSGLEANSECCQTSEMESFVRIVNGFEDFEYASLSFSFTAEIFTQKSFDCWHQKKGIFRKFYNNLHISEQDKKLQSVWTSKCKLTWQHLFFELFYERRLKIKIKDHGYLHMHNFCIIAFFRENIIQIFQSILYNLLRGLAGLTPEIHETKYIENYPKTILKVFNACFLHVLIW